jgi:hypothetical protein
MEQRFLRAGGGQRREAPKTKSGKRVMEVGCNNF